MTAAVAIKKKDNEIVVHHRMIPVVYKKIRIKEQGEASLEPGHSYKCHGGILNSAAVGGKGFYTRRLKGQDIRAVMRQLEDIAKGKQEHI
jgi:hypothetical protein